MKLSPFVEQYRERKGPRGTEPGEHYGLFRVPSFSGTLLIIASAGDANPDIPWEHVSVSLPNRCPTWEEMDAVKRLFWADDEAVMQLHPPRSMWVNRHPHCLHLWRPTTQEIPLPPMVAV